MYGQTHFFFVRPNSKTIPKSALNMIRSFDARIGTDVNDLKKKLLIGLLNGKIMSVARVNITRNNKHFLISLNHVVIAETVGNIIRYQKKIIDHLLQTCPGKKIQVKLIGEKVIVRMQKKSLVARIDD